MFSLSNFRNINKIFNFQLIIFFAWVAMWISINSGPGELGYMFKDKITFINGMRTIFAIIFSILMIMLAISLIIKDHKQFNKKSIILIIFLIHFVSQIIGLSLNPDRAIDLNNIYLVLYSISTISILLIIQNKNYENLIPFLIYFIIFILTVSVIFVISSSPENIYKIIFENNLYTMLHPDIAFNYQAPPRITGFSRTIAIINIFLITVLIVNQKKIYTIPLILLIYLFSIIIWMSQSRGSIICFYTSSAVLIFFFNNLNFLKKILIYFTITLFAILGTNQIHNNTDQILEMEFAKDIKKKYTKEINIKTNNDNDNDNDNQNKSNKKLLDIDKSRFITQKNTSGRTDLWRQSLLLYNYKLIFGYGPQADRIILYDHKNIYGNNSSNAAIYALLSGGYLSIICIILIYFYFTYLFLSFFIKEKLFKFNFQLNYKNSLVVISMIFATFFMIRSLVENSFSLFSIDFLITILSLFVIEQNKYKKIKI